MNKNNTKYNDYFSDDEKNNDEQNDGFEDDYESDGSIDEETRRIIYQATMKNINNLDTIYKEIEKGTVKEVKPIITKEKDKNSLSLSEFSKKVEDEINSKKPKKFVSKRVEDKKKSLGVEENVYKRQFNPRLPPYNFVNRKVETKQVNINDIKEFPQIKIN